MRTASVWGQFFALGTYGGYGKKFIYTLFKPSLTFIHVLCYICTGIKLNDVILKKAISYLA
jgi:hypothetical protein